VAQCDIVGEDVHGSCDGWRVVVIIRRGGGDWNSGRADGGCSREELYV